jgi:thioredoxin reductase
VRYGLTSTFYQKRPLAARKALNFSFLGGGLAALTAAIMIKRHAPSITVVIYQKEDAALKDVACSSLHVTPMPSIDFLRERVGLDFSAF